MTSSNLSAFFPSISCHFFPLDAFSPCLLQSLFYTTAPPSLFPIPYTNPLSFPKMTCNAGLQSEREGCCAVVWALRSAFRREEAFHTAECVVDIQRGSILSTRQQDCLPDRHATGGQRARCPHLLSRPLSALSRRPEPIPPQSLADKLNMIRRHRTGPESRGRRSHLRSGLCTSFDLYGN